MAPKKATAKSPKTKTTPARKAKADVVEVSSEANSIHDDVPDLDEEAAQDEVGSGDDSGPEPEAVTPARKGSKRKAAEDEEDEDESPGAKKPKVSSIKLSETVTESGGKKKHAHRNVKVEIPVSTPVTKPSGKHIVFNDDDGPAEFFTPQEAPAQELLDAQLSGAGGAGGADEPGEDDEGSDSDSDDDAPEAVSTHTAAAQAAESAQAATRAAEKQLELQKRKRQERDARLKQQAETRKKHQAASEKKAAAAAAKAEAEASPEPTQQAPGEVRSHLPSVSAAPTRKRLDKRALPDVLPDDFLEAASDEDDNSDQDDEEDGAGRRPKKPKFNTVAKQAAKAESRRPQDQRVGSTVYRVARPSDDPNLAPKAHKHSKNAKEVLLRRQRPVARKGGFLVKKRR